MDIITGNWEAILEIILAVMVVAKLVAKITPNEVDDEWIAKVLQFVDLLALNTKPTEKK